MTIAGLLCRLLIALTFLRAGLVKARGHRELETAIENYQLLPPQIVPGIAAVLPPAELALGLALFIGLATGPAAGVASVSLCIFAAAAALNLRRGRIISCGCAGTMSADISWRHVQRNLLLACAAAICSVWAVQPLSIWTTWGLRSDKILTNMESCAVLLATGGAVLIAMLVMEGAALSKLNRSVLQPAQRPPI